MPSALLRGCSQPNCPNLVEKGRCPEHQKERQRTHDLRRGSATSRGYGKDWEWARSLFLKRHPFCVDCEAQGTVEMATVVDHVIPHKGDQRLFWDQKNWAPRCGYHHRQKTVRHDGGFGNPVTPDAA